MILLKDKYAKGEGMDSLRKLGIGLLATLLAALLYGIAGTHVGNSTIRSREAVKNWFVSSKFYDQAVDVALEKAASSVGTGDFSIPINDPGIQNVARQAFNPAFLRQTVEGALDSGYGWLDGSRDKLDVKIDLTGPKAQLADGLAQYVTARVSGLPVCPSGTDFSNFDGYNATCRPSAVTPQQAGELAKQNFLNLDFLKNPVLSSDSLKVDDRANAGTMNAQEKLEGVKTFYQSTGSIPLILALLSLAVAAGIVFLSADKLQGVRRVGFVFLTTGTLLLVTYVVIGAGMGAMINRFGENITTSPKLAKMGADLLRVVASDVRGAMVNYLIAYIGLGAACIAASIVLKKRFGPHEPQAGAGNKDEPAAEQGHKPEQVVEPDKEPPSTAAKEDGEQE